MTPRTSLSILVAVLLWVAALAGCSGGSSPGGTTQDGPPPCGPGQTPPNPCPASPAPAPTLASITPSSMVAGGAAFMLTVDGSSFTASSVVDWNGAARPTTYVSAKQLTAAVSAADVSAAGTAQVTVSTPAPGGGTSS